MDRDNRENSYIYGYILALSTKNEMLLDFFLSGLNRHGGLNLKDMAFLVQVCKKLIWANGVLEIIKSGCCKSLFVLASLEEKIKFVKAVLS